jgi:ABC-type xylose transport system permease subunit
MWDWIKFDVVRLNHKVWIVGFNSQKIRERINFDLNICAKDQSIIRLLVNKCFCIVIILFYLYKFRGLKEYIVIRDHFYCKIS